MAKYQSTPKRKNSKGGHQLSPFTPGTQNPNVPLTEQQRRFVTHLVHDKLPQTAAARMAGYGDAASIASALMKNPKIQRAIAEERREYAIASGMTKQKVIDGFAEAIDLGRIKGDPVAMIAGWREIGKMCGFYEPTKTKVEVSVQGQVLIQRLNSMTDEQLLQLAEGDPTVLDGEFSVVSDDPE
jgi:hypothetical protein